MRIEISNKEFKNNKLEISQLGLCFLLSIKNKHPKLWKQLKDFINEIGEK